MLKVARDSLKVGLLAGLAGAASAGNSPTAAIPQDPTAKAILAELLAIDTTYEKGTVAAVEALRKRFTEQVRLEENRFRSWEQQVRLAFLFSFIFLEPKEI